MRIAFFSDVHANLPALEAVLQDIDLQHVDMVFCLGDLVGYNVWPNEVIQQIRRRKIPVIAGNHDEDLANSSLSIAKEMPNNIHSDIGYLSKLFTHKTVGEEERQYLNLLPRHLTLRYGSEKETFNILMVHGSPYKINEYITKDYPKDKLLRTMKEFKADILLFGHTHKPFHKILKDETAQATKSYHAINIGSVGKPKDGDPRACYVLLEIKETALKSSDNLSIEFRRVQYDVEKAAQAIEQSDIPNEFAEMLRKAY